MERVPFLLAPLALAALLHPACSGGGEKTPSAPAGGTGSAAAPEGKEKGPAAPAPAPPPSPAKSAIPPDGAAGATTASGLSYTVLKPGTGTVNPKRGDIVTVHYTGWLEDGTEFDSSRSRGEPVQYPLGNFIEGWNEALTLMTEGARWKLRIPAALAYGDAGSPPRIPPGANLVFDVELISFQSVPAPPAFRAPDPAAQKKTPGGTAWEVIEEGKGAACAEGDAFEMEYALWTVEGELCESSATAQGPLVGTARDMPFPFLKEAPFLMKEGGTILLEVPYEQGLGPAGKRKFPPGSRSIWRLTLKRVGHPVEPPAFEKPDEASLTALPSGLKIRHLKEGSGPSPRMGQEVVVHYTGWLATDGSLFDASWSRGLPATFRLGKVIDGWNEGLQTMKEGGEAILVIPPALGYGARGAGAKIPPDSTLVFRVQLIEVKK